MKEAQEKSAASVRAAETVVAFLMFAAGALVVWDSVKLGAKWAESGPESGYFPFYIGLLLCVSSMANFAKGWLAKRHVSFLSVSALTSILSVLIPTIVYVALIGGIGPLPMLGIYLPSILFIGVFMKWLGKYGWGTTLAVSIAVPVAFFVLFEIWFKVPLPKGPLETALGLA